MSLNSKIILSFLAGTFSALLAWVAVDFNGFYRLSDASRQAQFMQLFREQAFVGVLFGLFVGVAVGYVNGLSGGSLKQIQRSTAWGAAVGIGGGLLGLFVGQLFFGSLYVDPRAATSLWAVGPLIFIWDIFVRAVGWSLIGLFLGMAQGLPTGSSKAARHGAVGGFIGGLAGGTLFEIVPYILPPGTRNPGVISRGISMTVTGASIGLFIGLVETLLKQAWVRVIQGRNEGKEYVISKPLTTIGRDELSDIGLFGDRDISLRHAVIEVRNGRYVLRDAGSPLGTSVNGQRVTEHLLRDGDIIEIGSMRLKFMEKATASRVPSRVDVAPQPSVRIPTSENVCPFCGGRKDPSTGACYCTVGGQAQSPEPSRTPVPEPAAAVSGPRLVGISGPYAGQSFPLSAQAVTSIGREAGRDVQLPMDNTVSRRHARVTNEGGGFVVYDEGSSNGTFVNGVRVSQQPFAPGDVVQFGSSSFRLDQ